MRNTILVTTAFVVGALGSQGLEALIEDGAVLHAARVKAIPHVFQSVDKPEPGEEWKAHLTGGPVYDKIESLEATAISVANAREYGGEAVLVDDPVGCPVKYMLFECRIPATGKHWKYSFKDAPEMNLTPKD